MDSSQSTVEEIYVKRHFDAIVKYQLPFSVGVDSTQSKAAKGVNAELVEISYKGVNAELCRFFYGDHTNYMLSSAGLLENHHAHDIPHGLDRARGKFPFLSELMLYRLCVPLSAAGIERCFSSLKHIADHSVRVGVIVQESLVLEQIARIQRKESEEANVT